MTDYLVFWTDDQGADRFTFTRANTREQAESEVPGTGMVCETCGGDLMQSYGGWTHKRKPDKPHHVKPAATDQEAYAIARHQVENGIA
jgi:predicted HNH restriction endonuclease